MCTFYYNKIILKINFTFCIDSYSFLYKLIININVVVICGNANKILCMYSDGANCRCENGDWTKWKTSLILYNERIPI